MLEIYTANPLLLELQIAAHLDLQLLTSTTYALEGDRLEILLTFRRTEALRLLGQSIQDPLQVRNVLRNVSALIARNASDIRVGAVFKKQFPGADWLSDSWLFPPSDFYLLSTAILTTNNRNRTTLVVSLIN